MTPRQSKSKISRREFLLSFTGGTGTAPKMLVDYARSKPVSTGRAQTGAPGRTDMVVADSCTLCNACVESCPQHALAIHEGELLFESNECTGCGDCAHICPERSITLFEMKKPTGLPLKLVHKDEMIKCTRCNTPYVSSKMLRKITATLHEDTDGTRLCPNCRQTEIYGNLFETALKTPDLP